MSKIAIDARARIERYLGRVEEHIHGLPEEEREEILRDVDAHIRDALARRAPGGATEADVLAVLDEMDPPASWGSGTLPKSPPSPPAPEPPPPARDALVPVLALAAIFALLLAFAAAWISGRDAGGAPGLGLLAASLIGASAVAVAILKWNARVAPQPEGSARESMSGASFVLLVAAVGFAVVALVAFLSVPSYPLSFYEQSYAQQLEIRDKVDAMRDPHEVVFIAGLICASVAFLFSWIIGRVALAGSPPLTGWTRSRAQLAPGIASAALLATTFLLLPVMAFAIGQEQIFSQHRERIEVASATGFAFLVLITLLVGFGVLLRFAPGVIHGVFSPLTDRLKPRHCRGFFIAAAVFLLLGAGFLGVYLSATN